MMMIIRASPFILMVSMKSLCSKLSFSSSIRMEVIPMIAFMGVLISWLILAMKSDLAWAAASADSFALMRAFSVSLCFSISRSSSSFILSSSSLARDRSAVLSCTLNSSSSLALRSSSSISFCSVISKRVITQPMISSLWSLSGPALTRRWKSLPLQQRSLASDRSMILPSSAA